MSFYIPLIIFCISTSITPGPNNLMILMSGLNYGIKKSIPHYLGIGFGFAVMLLVIGLGLGTVFIMYPLLHTITKALGSAYILYLAYKTIRSSTDIKLKEDAKPISFMQASIFQLANPKAWIMAIGVFATFGSANQSIGYLQLLMNVSLITVIYSLLLLPCLGVWLVGGVVLRDMLQNEKQLRIFNWIMGSLLVLSIGLMFL